MSSNNPPDAVLVRMSTLIGLRMHAAKSFGKPRKKSTAMRMGNFVSPFKGRGMDFSEVRAYQLGDDIRSIDWRVTARTGKTHTKLFTEERERAIYFALDAGSNMQFGSKIAFKSVIASKVAALLAWSSISHGDRVGGILYAGDKHLELKPVGGKKGVLTFLKGIVDWNTQHFNQPTLLPSSAALESHLLRLKRLAKPGSLIFLVSDFSGLDERAKQIINQIAKHCDVVMIKIYDELEKNALPTGTFRLSNGVGEDQMFVSDKHVRHNIQNDFSEQETELQKYCLYHGIYYFTAGNLDDIPQLVSENMRRRA